MLPNFLIIGTAKAATSALYEYVREHPEVFMPRRKELHHFAAHPNASGPHWAVPSEDPTNRYHPVVARADYEKYFEPAGTRQAVGEASPTYLYYTAAAGNIREAIPHAKLIALLRDPADRAYSAWLHLVRDGHEALSFSDALLEEPARIQRGLDAAWHYRAFGFYFEKLKPYYALFPREQILVLLQEDLMQHPERSMKAVYRFLGVTDSYVPRFELQHNKTGIPKFPKLHAFVEKGIHTSLVGRVIKAPFSEETLRRGLTRIKNWNLQKPNAPDAVLEELRAGYRSDILKCQALIGRDLSHWLQQQPSA
jgi:hypothetical protein